MSIDISSQRQEHITLRYQWSEDPRDKLMAMFIYHAVPDGILNDGFARISVLGKNPDGSTLVEIVPIHPIDMPSHAEIIRANAEMFVKKTENRDATITQ